MPSDAVRHDAHTPAPSTDLAAIYEWREGHIAYLTRWEELDQARRDEVRSCRIPRGATGHPVIVLRRLSERSTHVLITCVSAHGAGPHDDFRAPWERPERMRALGAKVPEDFRAFHGSERPSQASEYLHLEGYNAWPKSQTSWVNTQQVDLVPVAILRWFTKPRRPQPLRVTRASLEDLRDHMARANWGWGKLVRDLETVEPAQSEPAGPAPSGTTVVTAAAMAAEAWRASTGRPRPAVPAWRRSQNWRAGASAGP